MKNVFLASTLLLLSTTGFAHDGGHGPKVTDIGKHGGKITAVIAKKDQELGPKAKLHYKAELVRVKGTDGKPGFRFYIYDKDMKPLPTDKLSPKASGILAYWNRVPGKKLDKDKDGVIKNFEMDLKKRYYLGMKLPSATVKKVYIDVFFRNGDQEYMAAYSGVEL